MRVYLKQIDEELVVVVSAVSLARESTGPVSKIARRPSAKKDEQSEIRTRAHYWTGNYATAQAARLNPAP